MKPAKPHHLIVNSEKRRNAQERYWATVKGVIELLPDPVIVVNALGSIVLANRQAEIAFGYKQEELIGIPVENLVLRWLENLDTFREQGHLTSLQEFTALNKNGQSFPVEVSLQSLKKQGQKIFWLSSIRDLTQQKEIKQELLCTREAKRFTAELENFAYIASHDLQEPLRKVTTYTSLFAEKYQDKLDPTATKYISYIQDGAKRMQVLIEDLLNYSRIGLSDAEMVEVNLNEVISRVLREFREVLATTPADISYDPLPTLKTNQTEMIQLFLNLISNAIKFREKDRKLEIRISVEKLTEDGKAPAYHFLVVDNGIGIETECYDQIFAMFRKLHSRARYPGSGIGLALCKKIVQHHGGQIWVDSILGKGSTFHFTLKDVCSS